MLNLFADFGVGGEVLGFNAFAAELLGRLALSGVILRFDALVHQPGGVERDLPTKFVIGHFLSGAVTKPINAARGFISSYLEFRPGRIAFRRNPVDSEEGRVTINQKARSLR